MSLAVPILTETNISIKLPHCLLSAATIVTEAAMEEAGLAYLHVISNSPCCGQLNEEEKTDSFPLLFQPFHQVNQSE